MDYLFNALQLFWLYGGSYFGALATASSFYALFFFFWTRTGDRKNKVDLETKAIYLYPIYKILRLSLVMIILAKVVEIIIVMKIGSGLGLDVSAMDIILSANGVFLYTIILLTAINSFFMSRKLTNFAYSIPMAVVSYFFIFLHSTRNIYAEVGGYFVPAGDIVVSNIVWYLDALVIFWAVFTYFSGKVRKKN